MAKLSAVLRSIRYPEGRGIAFWCPGCDAPVALPVEGPRGWQWDGDVERPTLAPSVLRTGIARMTDEQHKQYLATGALPPRVPTRCHLFLRAGRIEFLSDCSHALAGQTVDLPPWPERWSDGSPAEL